VICPSAVKHNWQKEVNMWVDRSSVVIEGLIKEVKDDDGNVIDIEVPDYKADFVIINYDILSRQKKIKIMNEKGKEETVALPSHKDELLKMGFKSMIIDESHYVKGHKSDRTQAVKELSRKIPYRFALTGTSMLNRPKELIPQLEILDRLDYFGGFWTFAKRYCGAKETPFGWDISGAQNLKELNQKLSDICYIRRLKSEVLTELPEKQRSMIPVQIDNIKEYKTVEKEFKKWIKTKITKEEESKATTPDIKTYAQKRHGVQAKISARIAQATMSEKMMKIEYLKQIVAQGKVNSLIEFVDNIIEQGEKVVVFANHKDMQHRLIDYYKKDNCASITVDRQQNKSRKMSINFKTTRRVK
jgi:SWI/SNF-related matrix-associated actin-dependent regulator 1 of chromatin subfamily A